MAEWVLYRTLTQGLYPVDKKNKSCLPSLDWLFPPFLLSPAVGTVCWHYHHHPYNPLTHLSTFFYLSCCLLFLQFLSRSCFDGCLSSSAVLCLLTIVWLSVFHRLWTTWRRGWRRQGSKSAFVRASLPTLLWPSKTSRCLLPPFSLYIPPPLLATWPEGVEWWLSSFVVLWSSY